MITQAQCPDVPDAELVQLTLKNKEYFMCIMSRYESALLRYVRRISSCSFEEAEDYVQDIFLKTYKNLESFDSSLKFSSWIYRIAHNHVISEFRKKKSKGELVLMDSDDSVFTHLVSEVNISANTDTSLARIHIEKALEQMDVKYREVVVLRYFEEKEYEEISDILQKPTGTIATLLNRAKKQLQTLLKAYE